MKKRSPVCRKCGFDLFGTPGIAICGECGKDQTLPGKVLVGHRQQRTGLVIAGISLFIPILFISSLAVWEQTHGNNWLKFAPTSWLVIRAESANASVRSPALAELNSRLSVGSIGTHDLTAMINAGLRYQADQSKTWDPAWGDLIELCESKRQLTDAQWKQYASQVWAGMFSVRIRPKVRRGDPVCCWIDTRPPREGSRSPLGVELKDWQLEWMDSHGMPAGKANRSDWLVSGGSVGSTVLPGDVPLLVPDGVQQTHLIATLNVGPYSGMHVHAVWEGTVDLPASFTLLPADSPSVAVVNDRDAAAQVYNSLRIDSVQLFKLQAQYAQVHINANGPPVGLSFDVFLRRNGKETKIGSFACPAQTRNRGYYVDDRWPTGNPAKPT